MIATVITQPTSAEMAAPNVTSWQKQLTDLCWVAYSPTNYDPNAGLYPSHTGIREDLRVLRQAGFEALVTYGAEVVSPELVAESGFVAMLVGVWDPTNSREMDLALRTGENTVVIGYAIGNEGLGNRYNRDELLAAMKIVRESTGRPVATTEELGDYVDSTLLQLGDWVFPNVHPYWHEITDPQQAATWTIARFREFARRTDKPVLFKEVGLPTAGDVRVSEQSQDSYYKALRQSGIAFVYFEAYDQPWKQWRSVEPHWGLFRADRSPKPAAASVCVPDR